MTVDTTIALVGIILSIVGMGVAGVAWAVKSADRSSNNRAQIEQLEREVRESVKEAELQRTKIRAEISQFREDVAKNYASIDIMNRMEERIVDALNRLGDRFDRYMRAADRTD